MPCRPLLGPRKDRVTENQGTSAVGPNRVGGSLKARNAGAEPTKWLPIRIGDNGSDSPLAQAQARKAGTSSQSAPSCPTAQ